MNDNGLGPVPAAYEEAVKRQARDRALKDYLKLPPGEEKDRAKKAYEHAAFLCGVKNLKMGFQRREDEGEDGG